MNTLTTFVMPIDKVYLSDEKFRLNVKTQRILGVLSQQKRNLLRGGLRKLVRPFHRKQYNQTPRVHIVKARLEFEREGKKDLKMYHALYQSIF